MDSTQSRELTFEEKVCQELQILCQQPINSDATCQLKAVIPDHTFQQISSCLKDIQHFTASNRPRTYTILHMMERLDLLAIFVAFGLDDWSLPYSDRRSFPPALSSDAAASQQFLDLQSHVITQANQMENGNLQGHFHLDSGDRYFKFLERLGKGGEATVDKVRSLKSGKCYARRKIHRRKDVEKDKLILNEFEREVEILKSLDHSHLVRVVLSYTDLKYVAMLMQPVASMNLKEYLLSRGASPQIFESERIRFRGYYGCLAHALNYLHQSKIKHKDIKPNNILIGNKGEIYITDFGSATEFYDDNSITRGTAKATTIRYQSPEVHHGTKRGRSSDIWSLGVTFLEMTTVLRGETLDTMLDFFQNNGTKANYVYNNIHTVSKWTEYLRQNTEYSRIDNAPMQWIRQMLVEKPNERPQAEDLFRDIQQASEGDFCGKCCNSDDSTTSDTSSAGTLDDEDTVRANTLIRPEEILDVRGQNPTSRSRKKNKSNIKKDTIRGTQHPRRSALHQVVGNIMFSKLPSLSSIRLPTLWSSTGSRFQGPMPNEVDNSVATANETIMEPAERVSSLDVISEVELHKVPSPLIEEIFDNSYDPFAFDMPGAFPFLEDHELIMEEWVIKAPRGAEEKPSADPTQSLDVPGIDQDTHKPVPTDVEEISDYEDINLDYYEDCAFNPGPSGFFTRMVVPTRLHVEIIKELTFYPGPPIKRCKSDESFQATPKAMEERTRALLNGFEGHSDDSTWTCVPKQSSNSFRPELELKLDIDSNKTHLRKMKQELDQAFTSCNFDVRSTKAPSALVTLSTPAAQMPQTASTSPSNLITPAARTKRAKKDNPGAPILSKHSKSSRIGGSILVTAEDVTETFVRDTTRMWEEGVMLDPGTSAEPPEELATSSFNSLSSLTQSGRPRMNNLRARFASLRAPPPTSGLTGLNLEALNDHRPPFERPRARIERASVYMKKVFDDTASSVATSVMSERTKNSFKVAGLFLPSQDRSCNYLGEHTKAGKVAAVRMLLDAGCNPGRKKSPRRAPIFNVVRGATSRHTKCLRELIDYGVDVNVWSQKTGKTPLLEAFEQDDWKGYVTVIYLLLLAGANPNVKDPSGDVPLLKLLGGGTQPLERHRRDALALLLSPSYKTDVRVTLLGTQNKPLHLAVRRNDAWAVGMLLEKNASVIEAENSEGLTPLLLAATFWKNSMVTVEQHEILDHLLEKKANVNVKMLRTSRTPLHIAVSHGLVDVVNELLKYGANSQMRTGDGKRAADLAEERVRQHGCQICQECSRLKELLPV